MNTGHQLLSLPVVQERLTELSTLRFFQKQNETQNKTKQKIGDFVIKSYTHGNLKNFPINK